VGEEVKSARRGLEVEGAREAGSLSATRVGGVMVERLETEGRRAWLAGFGSAVDLKRRKRVNEGGKGKDLDSLLGRVHYNCFPVSSYVLLSFAGLFEEWNKARLNRGRRPEGSEGEASR
jgi:hypothetical protein